MVPLKARVQNKHLIIDEPVDLPDGTEVELLAIDADDSLDEAERAALHAAIAEGLAELDRGEGIDAEAILQELRRSRP